MLKQYLLLILVLINNQALASVIPTSTPAQETTEESFKSDVTIALDESAVNITETISTVNVSQEENQCYSYCMANWQIYSKQTTSAWAYEIEPDSAENTGGSDTVKSGNDLDDLIKKNQFDCVFAELDSDIRETRWNGLKEAIEMVPTFKPQNQNEVMIFLAHVAHESDGLKTTEEYCGKDGSCADKYQGGEGTWCTTVPAASGKKYFGRGWFQLSWPCNYDAAGKALGLGDGLVQNPDQVAQSDKLACATALWFWNEKKMNEPAGQGNFGQTTHILNSIECGAENEKQKTRVQKYQSVRKCFDLNEETNNLMC